MQKKNHICLLTSCIIPNTKTGPITNLSKKERIIQLTKNLNYLLEKQLFREIYIIDPFLKNSKNIKEFSCLIIKNGLIKSNNVKYIKFKPDKKTKLQIQKNGKGYSELEMIIEANKKIQKEYPNTLIHKISGRYKILNIRKIIKKSEVIFFSNKKLFLPYSRLLSKCYTVIMSYRSDIDFKLFFNCLKDIDDEQKNYIEHSLYSNLVKKKFAYRNNTIPKFEKNMLGGSKQGNYGIYKQLINIFLYGYI
tara:strand:+ start:1235 stop:1981 length:747 start_codon:yes stop_codon:yes gene_type:complete